MAKRQGEIVTEPPQAGQAGSDLTFPCSRRRFLPMLVREAMVTLGMFRGRPGFRLSDLGSLPEDRLASIRPIVNPGFEIRTEDRTVVAQNKQTGAVVKLFSTDDVEALGAFNLFDGRHTLGEVGEQLAEEPAWKGGAAEAFSFARDLFLSLAGKLVCVPKDPLELD